MEFTAAGVLLNLADLSADQQRILAAEPMLVYSLVADSGKSPESEPEEAFADQDQDGIPDSKDRDADGDGKFESRPKKARKK